MKKILIIALLAFAGAVIAHGWINVQPKNYEFYDKSGIVAVELTSDNVLYVRLNTFELGKRENFCDPQ